MTTVPVDSLYDRFLETVAERHDSVAVVTDGERLTWGSFRDRVEGATAHLVTHGVRPGDHVPVMLGNDPAFLVSWLALARLGAVIVPTNPDLRGRSLRIVLEDCGAERIISTQQQRWEVGDDLVLDGKLDLIDPDAFPLSGSPPAPSSIPSSSPAAILYTSGTTGRPKGVLLSHRSYLAAGRRMVEAVGITAEDRILVCLPLFHANPQFYAVMAALTCGASLALVPRFSTSDFWSAAARLEATAFTYVGTVLSILQRTSPPDRHELRYCMGGGAPAGTWDIIEDRFGILIYELYGMTETGGFATINVEGRRQRGTCGTVRPDMEIAILDGDDVCLPPGQPGQIALRPSEPDVLFDGYLGMPDVTLDRYRNLWFHTGDIGELDEDGYLTFIGRDTNVIRRGGENIAPVQIEAALLRHPAVREAAVIGVDDEVFGQEIKALLVPEPDRDLDVWEVRDFVSRDIPRSAVPRYFMIVSDLPKTPTEKIRIDRLRHLEGALIDTIRPRAGSVD